MCLLIILLLRVCAQGQSFDQACSLFNALTTNENVTVRRTGASDGDSDSVRTSAAGECTCGECDSCVQSSEDEMLYDIEFVSSSDNEDSSSRHSQRTSGEPMGIRPGSSLKTLFG
jgi:hypothetical protein